MALLIVMAGTTGSGKTTVAKALARILPRTRHLESDVVRKQLAGMPSSARVATPDFRGGIYCDEMTDATYEEMNRQALRLLADGDSVVLDGSFRQRRRREAARTTARVRGAGVMIVECHVERSVQLTRLETRYRRGASPSEGRPELLAFHEQDWEAVRPDEGDLVIRVDTLTSIAALEALFADNATVAGLVASGATV